MTNATSDANRRTQSKDDLGQTASKRRR